MSPEPGKESVAARDRIVGRARPPATRYNEGPSSIFATPPASEPCLHKYLAPVMVLLAALGSACGGSDSSPPAVATVSVTLGSGSVGAGLTTNATAVLRDASGTVLTGRTVIWSSSPASTATVSPTGVVTAVAQGTAIVTATSEGKTGAAPLTVTANPVERDGHRERHSPAASTQATATLQDGSGNVLTGHSVTWSSSDSGVAAVSAAGLVTPVALRRPPSPHPVTASRDRPLSGFSRRATSPR